MKKPINLIKESMFILLISIFIFAEYRYVFSQITIHGTVKSSIDQDTPVENARVQLIGLDIVGLDTIKTLVDSTLTGPDGIFHFPILTEVQDKKDLPRNFELSSNYPNPFSDETNIDLFVKDPGNYEISIYNILGQLVASIQRKLSLGSYSIHWTGGSRPGLYFAKIQSKTEKRIIRLIQLTKGKNSSILRIDNTSITKLSKQLPYHASTSTSYLQIQVSKKYFQTYKGPVFPYESRSLNITLTYIGYRSLIGPIEVISTRTDGRVLTIATIAGDEALSLEWIEKEDDVDLIITVPNAPSLQPITLEIGLPTLENANIVAAVILGLDSGSDENTTTTNDVRQIFDSMQVHQEGNHAGCDGLDNWGNFSCDDYGKCCDDHDICIDQNCEGDLGNFGIWFLNYLALDNCLKEGILTESECREKYPIGSPECQKCQFVVLECFASPTPPGKSHCCEEGDCGELQQCIIPGNPPIVETDPCECEQHNLPSVDPCLPDSTLPCNSCGDVHMRTPDGLAYDFQGAGEYLFVASSDGDVVVQIRQEPWDNSNVVSVNTAVAMNVNGDRVGVYLGRSPELYINGQPRELSTSTLNLSNGGRIYLLNRSSRKEYLVIWPNGFQASVKLGRSYLDVGVRKPPVLQAVFEGLVGNLNGQTADDFSTSEGMLFRPPVTFNELYRDFGDSWLISSTESLFDYEAGASTETYTLPNFPISSFTANDLNPEAYEMARQACLAAGVTDPKLLEDCILDVAVTGDTEFVESALESVPPDTILELGGIINGGFYRNADGWVWKNLDSRGGWSSTGGNPGGNFIINQAGQSATDPMLCQTVTGLEVGQAYELTGDYASFEPQFGNPNKPDAFAVTLDGVVIIELPRPAPVSTEWTTFSTVFTSSTEEATICFVAERNGDDSSFRVDNITLKRKY